MNTVRTDQALLLRSVDTGDSDRVITLLSPTFGRFSAIARHARSSQKRFGPALQAFCLFEAMWKPKTVGLAFLESVHALEFPLGAEPKLSGLGSAYLFLELAHELCPVAEPQPAFFELVLGGLRRLGKGVEDPLSIRLSVLWGALALSGFAPDLEGRLGLGTIKMDNADREALRCASLGLPIVGNCVLAEKVLLEELALHLGRPLRTAGLAQQLNGETL